MMTTTEILKEIHRLPLAKQKELKRKLFEDAKTNGKTESKITQDEFDQILFDDGFLVNLPIKAEEGGRVSPEILREMLAEGMISRIPEGISDAEDDFEPIEIKGKPLSETLLEDRN